MKRTPKSEPWSRRRTEALLSLLKTQAPPDFQTQVLARVRELQQVSGVPRAEGKSLPGRWQGFFTCLQAVVPVHPLAAAASSISVFLLVSGLVWWSFSPRPDAQAPATEGQSLEAASQPNEHASSLYPEFDAVASEVVEGTDSVPGLREPNSSVAALLPTGTLETLKTTIPQEHLVVPVIPPPSSLESTGKQSIATPAPQR